MSDNQDLNYDSRSEDEFWLDYDLEALGITLPQSEAAEPQLEAALLQDPPAEPVPAEPEGLTIPEEQQMPSISEKTVIAEETERNEPVATAAEMPMPFEKEPKAAPSLEVQPAAQQKRSSRLSSDRQPGRNEVVLRASQLDEDLHDEGLEHRDYMPVRFRRDGKLGCLGGLMYATFIISVSIILACLGWMAASDVLALNKDQITANVEIPRTIYSEREVKQEQDGVETTVSMRCADIDYVANALKDAGIIEYPFLFKLYAKFANADIQIDSGTYELSTNFDYRALVKKMQTGSESQLQTLLTFPEGYTMRQIFAKLEDAEICSQESLYEAAATAQYSYSFLKSVTAEGPERLEGFLFPDTYYFYEGMSAKSAINKFLANMHYLITADMLAVTESRGLTWEEVIVIASLIERETSGSKEDRANISQVISNRLAAGMPLQIDASVLYDHPEHSGAPTAEMLAEDSPHNTHTRVGLPETAISNPGLESIRAAIYPSEGSYYYYALDTETGEHRFFKNLSEHQAFVASQNYGQ